MFINLNLIFRDEILTRPIFGNRVQQPHLQAKNGDDEEPKDQRPVEEEMDDATTDGSIVPKEEPIDIDDMGEYGTDVDNDRIE